MGEILNTFGIDWRLIVIQIFNFALLLALLWYFLYKPVLAMLDARQKKIQKGVEDADAAEQARARANDEKAEVLKHAHDEASTIVSRAETRGVEREAELIREAEEKRARLLADAEARAKESAARARKESEDEIAKLAILAAEKVLREKQH